MLNKTYWLSNGIYPKVPCFLHSVVKPSNQNKYYVVGRLGGCSRDTEHAFGVLQAQFNISAHPSRLWSKSDMNNIRYACIVLKKMILNAKRPLMELPARGHSSTSRIVVSDEVRC